MASLHVIGICTMLIHILASSKHEIEKISLCTERTMALSVSRGYRLRNIGEESSAHRRFRMTRQRNPSPRRACCVPGGRRCSTEERTLWQADPAASHTAAAARRRRGTPPPPTKAEPVLDLAGTHGAPRCGASGRRHARRERRAATTREDGGRRCGGPLGRRTAWALEHRRTASPPVLWRHMGG